LNGIIIHAMNETSIKKGVIMGRQAAFKGRVSNDDIAEIVNDYPGYFINCRISMVKHKPAITGVLERCKKGGKQYSYAASPQFQ
jgi:hypothetical protein